MKPKLFGLSGSVFHGAAKVEEASGNDIAIIGMSVKFPEADHYTDFWGNLEAGVDSIRSLPKSRQRDAIQMLQQLQLVKGPISFMKGAYLENIDQFDYKLFGMTPGEAVYMDPHQRLFLQTAWETIENAGYGGNKLKGSHTGIYVGFNGTTSHAYSDYVRRLAPEAWQTSLTGNMNAIIASRLAYLLDFRGPSFVIDTTCSSSLVAIHMACQGIRSGDCDMALAGGVRLDLLPIEPEIHIGIHSSDGRTKSFDDRSDGTGIGEGVASVLLKPLQQAKSDGDHIFAVIKGSAVNQDGKTVGITAPSNEAQEQVIVRAWKNASIDPETIQYIETHGTGTKLGDPIEIDGISRAFSKYTDKKQFCAIGSAKTHIGHLDSVAGIAGVVKAVLSLRYGKIPPLLHFESPNRSIPFIDSPVYINDQLADWPKGLTHPRRCGVSSFGLSGTNCHLVMEENVSSEAERPALDQGPYIINLSAKYEEGLIRLAERYKGWLNGSDIRLADLCFTANTGRGHYSHRLSVVFGNMDELLDKLNQGIQAIRHDLAIDTEGVYYGKHSVIDDTRTKQHLYERTRAEIRMLSETANQALHNEKVSLTERLNAAGSGYANGADVRWESLYASGSRRIPLPTYPFAKTRCWAEPPVSSRFERREGLFHKKSWINIQAISPWREEQARTIMVVHVGHPLAMSLLHGLRNLSHRVIEVKLQGREDDYERIAATAIQWRPDQIIHAVSFGDEKGAELDAAMLEARMQQSVYSLFHLTRSLLHHQYRKETDVVLITPNAEWIEGQQADVRPENTAMAALGHVIRHEYPHLKCRCLDVDGNPASMRLLVSEIDQAGDAIEFYMTLFREGKRYIEQLIPIDNDSVSGTSPPVRSGGVYIITGGLGGIGMAAAAYLASQQPVQLMLVSRSKFPEPDRWSNLGDEAEEGKWKPQLERIKHIQATGSSVTVYDADVADAVRMESVIRDIQTKHGAIHGVVHCAGLAGDGFLIRKSFEQFKEVLSPKVQGTLVLHRLTQAEPLDFFVLSSSVTSLLGTAGQGDYAAANAFQEGFSYWLRQYERNSAAIQWTTWAETGMAVNYGVQHSEGPFQSITTEEAVFAFEEVLQMDIPAVIVGRRRTSFSSSREAAPVLTSARSTGVLTASLSGNAANLYTEEERHVSALWQEVLGYDDFHVEDNFFEIGGDSLLLVRIHSLLQQPYKDKVSIVDLFTYPTISKLAAFLQETKGETNDRSQASNGKKRYLNMFEEIENGTITKEEVLKQSFWREEGKHEQN